LRNSGGRWDGGCASEYLDVGMIRFVICDIEGAGVVATAVAYRQCDNRKKSCFIGRFAGPEHRNLMRGGISIAV
jgi:hypothetical protein